MACTGSQLRFLERIKNNKSDKPRPEWFIKFLQKSSDVNPINCGGYKIVYPFGDHAIAIERGNKPMDPSVLLILKMLPKKHQKHLIYPLEHFITEEFTVSKLSLCPFGDLFDMFNTPNAPFEKLTPQMFVDLASTLDVLHSYNIAVTDLKPENIMMCTCNCLAFIDLDSVTSLSEGKPKYLKAATLWWNPILIIDNKKPRDYFISDWGAFALITLEFIGQTLTRKENFDILSRILVTSSSEKDYRYKWLKLQYIKQNSKYDSEFEDALNKLDLSPMKKEVVQVAMKLLNTLILYDRFGSEVASSIKEFQDALGLDVYFQRSLNNGRVRLSKNKLLKF